jgi:hypothetical protein
MEKVKPVFVVLAALVFLYIGCGKKAPASPPGNPEGAGRAIDLECKNAIIS